MKSAVNQAALIVVAAVVLAAPAGVAAIAQETQKSCCFANPSYNGICTVAPGEDETCDSILRYLNNPASVGRRYCGGTTIRGGWQQVDCPEAAESCSAGWTGMRAGAEETSGGPTRRRGAPQER